MSYQPYVFTHGGGYEGGSQVSYYNETSKAYRYDLDPRDVTCRVWLTGACRSRYCYYTHEYRDYVSPPQPYTCWFWSMGRCTETAETCTYTHSLDALSAQRPRRFARDHPVIGGRNAAIANAAEAAGFNTRNGYALSKLLKEVKHANSGFEEARPRPREPLPEAPRPSRAQPAEVRTGGDYYRPRESLPENLRPSRAQPAEIRTGGDYYRPKRHASPINGHHTLEYDDPAPTTKRQRTVKDPVKFNLPNLPPPTQANRSILAPRNPNTNVNVSSLAIRSRPIASAKSKKAKKSQLKVLTKKEQALLHTCTRKAFEKAEHKVKGCVDALNTDKATLSKRWEVDARLQRPEMAVTLDCLAEGMHQALLGLEIAGKEIKRVLDQI